jgi:hypothetical protein
MQKWEYATVVVTDTTTFRDPPQQHEHKRTVEFYRKDGASKPLGADMLASFQQLGAEGWELFSMNGGYGGATNIVLSYYWFKRPVQA